MMKSTCRLSAVCFALIWLAVPGFGQTYISHNWADFLIQDDDSYVEWTGDPSGKSWLLTGDWTSHLVTFEWLSPSDDEPLPGFFDMKGTITRRFQTTNPLAPGGCWILERDTQYGSCCASGIQAEVATALDDGSKYSHTNGSHSAEATYVMSDGTEIPVPVDISTLD